MAFSAQDHYNSPILHKIFHVLLNLCFYLLPVAHGCVQRLRAHSPGPSERSDLARMHAGRRQEPTTQAWLERQCRKTSLRSSASRLASTAAARKAARRPLEGPKETSMGYTHYIKLDEPLTEAQASTFRDACMDFVSFVPDAFLGEALERSDDLHRQGMKEPVLHEHG